ncbi:MAG: putative sulfate exporter family transporter [Fibrobacter sp.]|nr:putative sulfate exporter family transporter [Fibrobacter sp.]MCQ2124821.1 putative sulfate exporter family transporter [Fibrobacter sp.]
MKEKIAKIAFVALILAACCPCVASWMALLAGIVYAFAFGGPAFPKFAKKTQKYLLQGCVVGLGFGMNLQAALASGKDGMMFTIVSVVSVMVLGFIIGKVIKVDTKTSYLISSGTAICGGSAIAAVAPVVDADDKQMSVSLGTVFVLNALALLIFPPLGHYFGLTNQQFGEWAAIAIHDTSSVVGAAAAYSDESLQVAAMVKCTRALWILPLALITMVFFRKNSGKGKFDVIPWFIFLFAIAMVINTYLFPAIGVPAEVGKYIVMVAKRGFAITLFLIGTGLSKDALKKCGAKPFIQGVVLWAVIGVGSLLVIKGF